MSKTTIQTGGITADAINGTLIADDAINSEHYTDGSIDTAHVADSQITLAKTSGVGNLVKIAGVDSTSDSNGVELQSCFNNTYDSYMMVVRRYIPASNNRDLLFQIMTGTNTVVSATNYFYAFRYFEDTNSLGGLRDDDGEQFKIADDAISEEHLDATAITGHTALGATPADTDEIIISDAGTLKRLDYSYIKGGTNTPYFSASITSNQTATHDTMTKVNFDRADVDSASSYDTTNKRYAVPSGQGGYWMIGYNLWVSTTGNKLKSVPVYLFKGGDNLWSFNARHQTVSYMRSDDNPLRGLTLGNTVIGTLSAGDTVEVRATVGHSDGSGNTGTFNEYYSVFWGMKLAGA